MNRRFSPSAYTAVAVALALAAAINAVSCFGVVFP